MKVDRNVITVDRALFKAIVSGKVKKISLPDEIEPNKHEIVRMEFFDRYVMLTQRFYLRVKKVEYLKKKWYRKQSELIIHV